MKSEFEKECERFLFDFGRIVLGKDTGGMIVKLKHAIGISAAWNEIKRAREKSNPKEWIVGYLKHHTVNGFSSISGAQPVVDHDAVAARHGYHWNGDKYIKQGDRI